ncbi:MAG: hypothetical protein ACOY45_07770 [Pseudomonadota bacterium]
MALPPPDLSSVEGRAAYRAELRGVARGLRMQGVGLSIAGALLAVLRATVLPMPASIPLVVLCVGAAAMTAGVVIRTRYHARRMRGQ